jgi:lysozyme
MSWFEVFKKHVRWAEGYSTTEYPDSKGIPTIGIGHNLRAKRLPDGWTQPLSDDQINILFEGDTLNAIEMVMHHFGDCFGSWTDNRKAAIVDLMFNMGASTFRDGPDAFGPTFTHIRAGEWEEVARHLEKTQWFRDVKRRGPRVVQMIKEG